MKPRKPRKPTSEELFGDTWTAEEARAVRDAMAAARAQFAQTPEAQAARAQQAATFASVQPQAAPEPPTPRAPKAPGKRQKPETAISLAIRKHAYRVYGAVTTRANAGFWQDAEGNVIRGADAGTADLLMCIPMNVGGVRLGLYFGVEVKRPGQALRDNQSAFAERVRAAGGVAVVATCPADLDAAIAQAAAILAEWFPA